MKSEPYNCKIIDTYGSKKNTVHRVECKGEYYIIKKYSEEFIHGLLVEETILNECSKIEIGAPVVIERKKDTLILEYIPGSNCKILFDSEGKEKIKRMLSQIAAWLDHFHRSFNYKKSRGDCILANFIQCDSRIYGIDFEESGGDYLRDIGDMCTSILRMEPSFTKENFTFAEYFIDEYFFNSDLSRRDVTASVVGSMRHYSKYGSTGKKMKRWSEKIKEEGLNNIFQN
ncbi:MAG: hypothetical protein R6U17_02795 [Thermoplasmata archaeon]